MNSIISIMEKRVTPLLRLVRQCNECIDRLEEEGFKIEIKAAGTWVSLRQCTKDFADSTVEEGALIGDSNYVVHIQPFQAILVKITAELKRLFDEKYQIDIRVLQIGFGRSLIVDRMSVVIFPCKITIEDEVEEEEVYPDDEE